MLFLGNSIGLRYINIYKKHVHEVFCSKIPILVLGDLYLDLTNQSIPSWECLCDGGHRPFVSLVLDAFHNAHLGLCQLLLGWMADVPPMTFVINRTGERASYMDQACYCCDKSDVL